MKKTYTNIKDTHKKTGRGRVAWEYFDLFEEVYETDLTMNMPKTISSTGSNLNEKEFLKFIYYFFQYLILMQPLQKYCQLCRNKKVYFYTYM